MKTAFVSKHAIKERFGLGWTSQKVYRLNGTWIENIHWVRINPRVVRYNLTLIEDWFSNRGDWQAHQRAIDIYQSQLLSNQKTGRDNRLGKHKLA